MGRMFALIVAAAFGLGGAGAASDGATRNSANRSPAGDLASKAAGGVGRRHPRLPASGRPQQRPVEAWLSPHCRTGAPGKRRRQPDRFARKPRRGPGAPRSRRQCRDARGPVQGPRLRERHPGNIGGSPGGVARKRQAHAIRCRGHAEIRERHRVRSRRRALCADSGAACRQRRAGHGGGPWRCRDDQSDQRMGHGAHARAYSLHHRARAAGTRARRA